MHETKLTLLSKTAVELGVPEKIGMQGGYVAVENCRGLTKAHMVRNDVAPKIEIDPETYQVKIDGNIATCEPAKELALTQLYFMV